VARLATLITSAARRTAIRVAIARALSAAGANNAAIGFADDATAAAAEIADGDGLPERGPTRQACYSSC
jgi:hypothetical protein